MEEQEGKLKILHVIDHLGSGGAEKNAVLLANATTNCYDDYRVTLCSVRSIYNDLEELVDKRIRIIRMNRGLRSISDLILLIRYYSLIKKGGFDLVHCHNTTVKYLVVVRFFLKFNLIWHDNFGRTDTKLAQRNPKLYKLILNRLSMYIGVNSKLMNWAENVAPDVDKLYLTNFAMDNLLNKDEGNKYRLPGLRSERVICLANLRRQKNHLLLIQAWKKYLERTNNNHYLILAGLAPDRQYLLEIISKIESLSLQDNVVYLGSVTDPSYLLKQCSVGVLSSDSEGLPLALLEYGIAELAPIVTDVGQCSEVVQHEINGLLVNPGSIDDFSAAIGKVMDNRQYKEKLAANFAASIRRQYTVKEVLNKLIIGYQNILR